MKQLNGFLEMGDLAADWPNALPHDR